MSIPVIRPSGLDKVHMIYVIDIYVILQTSMMSVCGVLSQTMQMGETT